MNRWSIYIDIEGFSKLYKGSEGKAHYGIGCLASHIYNLGKNIYNGEFNPLFVHQLGDGFVIVSLNNEKDIDRSIIVTITLMRLMLISGYMTKASISIGDFADVVGCYPKFIQDEYYKNETIRIGHGVLRIFPVMGSALINSWKLLNKSASGPNLTLDKYLKENVKLDGLIYGESTDEFIEINWLHSKLEDLEKIGRALDYTEITNINFLKIRFEDYIKNNDLPIHWFNNANKILNANLPL